MGCERGGWTDEPGHFVEVDQSFSRAGFSGSYWFMRPVEFYEGPDILLNYSGADGYLRIAFRNETAIEQLSNVLREDLNVR